MSTSVNISLSNEAWEKRLRATRHRLYDIDLENKTAFCTVCGYTEIHISKLRTRKTPKVLCIHRFSEITKGDKEKRRSRAGWKPRHVLTEIDLERKTATCSVCGRTGIRKQTAGKYSYYMCATKLRKYTRTHRRTHYSPNSANSHAHVLSEIDEEKKTAVCSKCGQVEIYIWHGKRKLSRRCSNASVSGIPGAEEIRRAINTEILDRHKVQNGCKRCGYNSNDLRLSIYSKIGRKKAVRLEKLLKLNSGQLGEKLGNCEVFCVDCRS